MIKTIILVYLLIGILSRAAIFIAKDIVNKKYNCIPDALNLGFAMELFAHALDVIHWPSSTYISIKALRLLIKEAKKANE